MSRRHVNKSSSYFRALKLAVGDRFCRHDGNLILFIQGLFIRKYTHMTSIYERVCPCCPQFPWWRRPNLMGLMWRGSLIRWSIIYRYYSSVSPFRKQPRCVHTIILPGGGRWLVAAAGGGGRCWWIGIHRPVGRSVGGDNIIHSGQRMRGQ